jgi:large subunit ribosomal protein L25
MLTLKAQKRDLKVKPESLRKSGSIPAVFYGKKQEATPIAIKTTDFKKIWEEAGESTVVTIETPEGKVDSLIHDVDFDPVSGAPRHADFYVFEAGHKVEVEVPLEFVGVSTAVKDLGGVLVKVLHVLKIEAEPKNLPHNIEVDISGLVEFNNQVLAKDIAIPAGVTLKEHADEVVALVSAPREEKEEEVAPIDLASIEVEKKGKEEVPAEGAEAPAEAEKKA